MPLPDETEKAPAWQPTSLDDAVEQMRQQADSAATEALISQARLEGALFALDVVAHQKPDFDTLSEGLKSGYAGWARANFQETCPSCKSELFFSNLGTNVASQCFNCGYTSREGFIQDPDAPRQPIGKIEVVNV